MASDLAQDFDATTPNGRMFTAIEEGSRFHLEDALRDKADPNAVNRNGWPALVMAVRKGDPEMVRELLEKGADAEKAGPDGTTALGAAAGNAKLARIIERGVSDRFMNELFEAIRKKNADEVQRILELKKIRDLNKTPEDGGWTPIALAISEAAVDCLDLILQAGAHPDGEGGKLPLIDAITSYHEAPRLVDTLLAAGANADLADQHGDLPLAVAARRGLETIVLALLAHGANPNINARNGNTPAHMAAMEGDTGILDILAAHGADFNLVNESGQTPMEVALLHRHSAAYETLRANGCKPQARSDGFSLLMAAACAGETGMFQALMKDGAGIDARTNDGGFTALMFAAWYGKGNSTRALLALGANYALADAENKTALDIARERSHAHVAAIISEKIAEDVRHKRRAPDPVKKPFRISLEAKNV